MPLFYHRERFPAPHKVRMSHYPLDVYTSSNLADSEGEKNCSLVRICFCSR